VEEEGEEAETEGVTCFVESIHNRTHQLAAIEKWQTLGRRAVAGGGHIYRRSRSCIPVTFFCAYVTISLNRYAKLALLNSAVRVRLRFRS